MKINILGTEYIIVIKPYNDDPYFKENNADGYCDYAHKEITVVDFMTHPDLEGVEDNVARIEAQKATLRHEIIHAHLYESGLYDATFICNDPWATNEEMVNWFSIQGPKIYKAWQDANALTQNRKNNTWATTIRHRIII